MSETTSIITDPLLLEMIEAGLISAGDAEDAASLGSSKVIEQDELSILDTMEQEDSLKLAAYSSQEAMSDVIEVGLNITADDAIPPTKTTTARTRKSVTPRKTSSPKVARPARDGGSLGDYIARLIGPLLELNADSTAVWATESVIDGIAAVKVREKAANFLAAIHGKANMSVFSKIALDHLLSKGFLSAQALVTKYQTDSTSRNMTGYSIGTARSQAQQMMGLFRALMMIDASGNIVEASALLRMAGYTTHTKAVEADDSFSAEALAA